MRGPFQGQLRRKGVWVAYFLVQPLRNSLIFLHLIHLCVQIPVRLRVHMPYAYVLLFARHLPKYCELSDWPRMSIFLRQIDSAVVVPVYTIWENAFGRVVCCLRFAALASRFESCFYYPLFDDNYVQLRHGRKLLQSSEL